MTLHSINDRAFLKPSVNTFEIVPTSAAQQEDAGWYYELKINGRPIGEPNGPFPSADAAARAAKATFLD